jgi:hypothetical protein
VAFIRVLTIYRIIRTLIPLKRALPKVPTPNSGDLLSIYEFFFIFGGSGV